MAKNLKDACISFKYLHNLGEGLELNEERKVLGAHLLVSVDGPRKYSPTSAVMRTQQRVRAG